MSREHRERIAEALYDAWWQGIEDSRVSCGGKLRWADVTVTNRQRFYRWAAEAEQEPTP